MVELAFLEKVNSLFLFNKSAKTRQKFYKKRAKALKINAFALKNVREMSPESTPASTHLHVHSRPSKLF